MRGRIIVPSQIVIAFVAELTLYGENGVSLTFRFAAPGNDEIACAI